MCVCVTFGVCGCMLFDMLLVCLSDSVFFNFFKLCVCVCVCVCVWMGSLRIRETKRKGGETVFPSNTDAYLYCFHSSTASTKDKAKLPLRDADNLRIWLWI